jgi:hypothetical protein
VRACRGAMQESSHPHPTSLSPARTCRGHLVNMKGTFSEHEGTISEHFTEIAQY